jgi:hypothetical protein
MGGLPPAPVEGRRSARKAALGNLDPELGQAEAAASEPYTHRWCGVTHSTLHDAGIATEGSDAVNAGAGAGCGRGCRSGGGYAAEMTAGGSRASEL